MPIRGDQDKLEVLLDALVDNAVKFNRTDGLLSINAENMTRRGKAMVCLQIFNQGQSVPHEHAEDIFQGYSQLGELDADKPSGVGIGLATCRACVRRMGKFIQSRLRLGGDYLVCSSHTNRGNRNGVESWLNQR